MTSNASRQPDERARALAALELRIKGHTNAQIAAQLDYADESGARHAISRLLARREAESIDEMRAMHSARLEAVLSSFWSGMVAGDADAARIVLRSLDSLARLYGLDAPTKVAVGNSVSEVEFANEAAGLIERIASRGELGQFVGGLRAQAVGEADDQMPIGASNDPADQPDALSEAYSGALPPDDLAGWSNIGGPDPEPVEPVKSVEPAAPVVPLMPEPEPQPAPQPVRSPQPAAPPAWMRRRLGDGYNPTAGWRP